MEFEAAPLVIGPLRLSADEALFGFLGLAAILFVLFGARRDMVMLALVAGFATLVLTL